MALPRAVGRVNSEQELEQLGGEDEEDRLQRELEDLEEPVEADDGPPSVGVAPLKQDAEAANGIPMKWISLVLLTICTSGRALLVRWTKEGHSAPYISSTVVFFTEILKIAISAVVVLLESDSIKGGASTLLQSLTGSPMELASAALPSLVYTLQNNLTFYSFEKLSAPVQQVLIQMKILTTALLSVSMLGQSLTVTKWVSCLLLTVSVMLVQWPRSGSAAMTNEFSEQLKGFLAVLMICFTSSFASVFIQRMLQGSAASVSVRNVQFGVFGALASLMVAFAMDGAQIARGGFMQGYGMRVYSVLVMNAAGGLLCAVSLKYAGATLGCFSTAISIILTSVLSWTVLQDFMPDLLFLVGAALTILSSLLFGLGLPPCLSECLERCRAGKGSYEVAGDASG